MSNDIEFRDVSFTYAGADKPALRNINLNISPGEVVLITGPAGSGKTTLCSCINGLIPHFHEGELVGEVLVRTYRTARARIGGLASLVGMVFQDPESQLVTNSVGDEIAFGPENLGIPREEINARVQDSLKATRLVGYEEREPHSLSGGEQQANVIAAVYAMQPEIYIMDEPLANLDPIGRTQVLKVVVDVVKQRGKTLVIVEHSLEEVLPLVDRVIVVHDGEIIRDGTVAEILAGGEIPNVFTPPPIVQLADTFQLNPIPLTPDDFYDKFSSQYHLHPIPELDLGNNEREAGPKIIELQDVSFSYDQKSPVLRHINLEFHAGEITAILGRNGSGKTTLVRHIIGLLQPNDGKVVVLGKDVSTTPTYELAQDVGFCFQNPNHQIVSFNVRDEVVFGLKAHHIDPAEFESRTKEALEFVDILDYIDAEVFDLGKGQKQRLALASVLTLRPRILIIDEPTTGQDPRMAREIFEIIKRLNESGTTVLMITHKIDYAAIYAHRAVVLQKGEVVYDGGMQDLMSDSELMQANSLDLPDTTKLASKFSQYGVPPWLVKTEDLAHVLRQLVEAPNGH
ncbi:MAG: ABC transporter ATP-binding protein [Chloroflexota bacterium]|nr:MAG: ABC transporter ATP-binding protein [Chloroflexota bacterium]